MTNIFEQGLDEKHCMVDLETLGTNSRSPVIQIGLVFFTIQGIQTQSLLTVDFDDALKYGKADGSTIKWWLQQDTAAQKTLFENPRSAEECAEIIEKLITAQNPNYFWAHATFDFPILNSMFDAMGRKRPVPFRTAYDLRTLEYFAGNNIEWEKREGVYHNALDDATYQAKHAIKMLRYIKTLKGELK
jgi:hypothetical protein